MHDTQKNSRVFVDDDFVDAARAGDVYRWIEDPRPETLSETFLEWTNLMRDVGLSVLRHRLAVSRIPVVAVQTALVQAQKIARATGLHAELMRIVLELGSSPARPVALADIHLPSLRLAVGADGSSISLTGCLIELLDLSEVGSPTVLPTLRSCSIEVVQGIAGIDELATERIVDCDFGQFSDSTENMSAILKLDLPDYTRVALTVLRKIFVQSGHSRKESALYRGSLSPRQKDLIPRVLTDLQSDGAIRKIRRRDTTLWESNRAMYRRVHQLLDAPTTTTDPLVTPRKT